MVTDTATRSKVRKDVEVVLLTDLVTTLHDHHDITDAMLPELIDPDLRYILVDAGSYEEDVLGSDPTAIIVRYSNMVQRHGKKLIVFDVGDLARHNIESSRANLVLGRRGACYTPKDLGATLKEYCPGL